MPIRAFRHEITQAFALTGTPSAFPEVGPIEIVRDADAVSPYLTHMLTTGATQPDAAIVLADGAFEITIEDVRLAEVGIDGTQDGLPTEKLVLEFGSIRWEETEDYSSVDYDLGSHEGGGGAVPSEAFVFFGPGVPVDAFPEEIPFSKLQTGISRQDGSLPTAEPVTLVTSVSAATVWHLGQLVGTLETDIVNARFTALGDGGAIIDRYAIRLENAWVESVLLETDPSGSLNETIAYVYGLIQWSAQPGGVVDEWAPFEPR